ncbi:MAG: hypothetical protein NTY94_18485, partial [Alphaproteobacteria bacterium]|nr:hypothetical protein [Alphaproteobacteria bacterium]
GSAAHADPPRVDVPLSMPSLTPTNRPNGQGITSDSGDSTSFRMGSKAIFESKATHVYFGIYQSENEKIKRFNGQLSMYQKKRGSDKSYSFYESESAMVWG